MIDLLRAFLFRSILHLYFPTKGGPDSNSLPVALPVVAYQMRNRNTQDIENYIQETRHCLLLGTKFQYISICICGRKSRKGYLCTYSCLQGKFNNIFWSYQLGSIVFSVIESIHLKISQLVASLQTSRQVVFRRIVTSCQQVWNNKVVPRRLILS